MAKESFGVVRFARFGTASEKLEYQSGHSFGVRLHPGDLDGIDSFTDGTARIISYYLVQEAGGLTQAGRSRKMCQVNHRGSGPSSDFTISFLNGLVISDQIVAHLRSRGGKQERKGPILRKGSISVAVCLVMCRSWLMRDTCCPLRVTSSCSYWAAMSSSSSEQLGVSDIVRDIRAILLFSGNRAATF